MKKVSLLLLLLILTFGDAFSENGYRLWLRYDAIGDLTLLDHYSKSISGFMLEGTTPTLGIAREELQQGLNGMLDRHVNNVTGISDGIIIAGTPSSSPVIQSLDIALPPNGGYIIRTVTIQQKKVTVIAAAEDIGILYGVYHFLRLLQTHQKIDEMNVAQQPKTTLRILNHWDNLDRTVERGYAGFSLWDWHKLPDYITPVYTDYARANASIGINGTVLTNVNANSLILTGEYLPKVAALADVFRPYGIKVYLTARFSAPIETGNLKTADPLDPMVIAWWKSKVEEVYRYIPDFGGFLVKANSEGQPGPQNYGRSHAEGANMLADALRPFGGIVMWRAFVYDNNIPVDRAMQAYNEFVPLDGKFRDNVIIQVKNGPVDFQPREPFHPLFGAMKNTSVMAEFQITQEYLGFATHLVYLAPLYTECLTSDTRVAGKGSTVTKVIDGTLKGVTPGNLTGMAGVTNIGNEVNWTGHPFGQANWYAYGRLAWDPYLSAGEIANEWIGMTFTNNPDLKSTLLNMMLRSREITVNYMTPLGLHHLMGKDHHYGPGPWVNEGRADWTSVYYHKAGPDGIGFNRSSTGSNAVSQYADEAGKIFDNPETCPEGLLLWFHHLSWNYRVKSGRTLWEELCYKYHEGADSVVWLKSEWQKAKGIIDEERFEHVDALLNIQIREARWWRDACISYFQQQSGLPIPYNLEKPEHSLEYYKNLKFHFVPGI